MQINWKLQEFPESLSALSQDKPKGKLKTNFFPKKFVKISLFPFRIFEIVSLSTLPPLNLSSSKLVFETRRCLEVNFPGQKRG